ncbi:inverse autotransporter beta domain-containing protein [Citrobacter cronae]|uniref:inverse autotransporter beta domain-containing protein n=1 Tax=Citrobacter cronae TaxID=1748967 RepID=UPI0026462A08|nr:inverse autotransporter beta domain-containing protein [Citrobacter cronae]
MAAGEAALQWLSHFGTARVQLDTDEYFSLKNSQLDLLAPLYDSKTGLLFSQGWLPALPQLRKSFLQLELEPSFITTIPRKGLIIHEEFTIGEIEHPAATEVTYAPNTDIAEFSEATP